MLTNSPLIIRPRSRPHGGRRRPSLATSFSSRSRAERRPEQRRHRRSGGETARSSLGLPDLALGGDGGGSLDLPSLLSLPTPNPLFPSRWHWVRIKLRGADRPLPRPSLSPQPRAPLILCCFPHRAGELLRRGQHPVALLPWVTSSAAWSTRMMTHPSPLLSLPPSLPWRYGALVWATPAKTDEEPMAYFGFAVLAIIWFSLLRLDAT